jgi:hypothetical protein
MRDGPNRLDHLPGNAAGIDDAAFLIVHGGLKVLRIGSVKFKRRI